MNGKVYTDIATFPSSSNPSKSYTVKEDQQGNLSCDCPAWVFKKNTTRTCKHVEEVERQGRVGSRVQVQASQPVEIQTRDRERGGALEDLFKRLDKGGL